MLHSTRLNEYQTERSSIITWLYFFSNNNRYHFYVIGGVFTCWKKWNHITEILSLQIFDNKCFKNFRTHVLCSAKRCIMLDDKNLSRQRRHIFWSKSFSVLIKVIITNTWLMACFTRMEVFLKGVHYNCTPEQNTHIPCNNCRVQAVFFIMEFLHVGVLFVSTSGSHWSRGDQQAYFVMNH